MKTDSTFYLQDDRNEIMIISSPNGIVLIVLSENGCEEVSENYLFLKNLCYLLYYIYINLNYTNIRNL